MKNCIRFISLCLLITAYSLVTLIFSVSSYAATNKQHYPAVFLGYTKSPDSTDFTYGFEYEYKFTPQWGAGFVYEEIDDAHHGDGITIKVAELFYHPTSYIRLGAGFGKEEIGGDHPHSEDLTRISMAYEYHIGDFGIEPTFAIDFVGSHKSYILGIAFVRPF